MRTIAHVAATLILFAASISHAQEAAKTLDLTLHDANGADALIRLFERGETDYAFGESVAGIASAGRVSLSIHADSVKAGLEEVFKALDPPHKHGFDYFVEDRVFHLRCRKPYRFPEPLWRPATDPSSVRTSISAQANSADAVLSRMFDQAGVDYIFARTDERTTGYSANDVPFESALRGFVSSQLPDYAVDRVQGAFTVYWRRHREDSEGPISLRFTCMDLRYAIKALFTVARINYTLDQAVAGHVYARLKDVSIRRALESILRCSTQGLTYRIEDGVYIIYPKREDADLGPELR